MEALRAEFYVLTPVYGVRGQAGIGGLGALPVPINRDERAGVDMSLILTMC